MIQVWCVCVCVVCIVCDEILLSYKRKKSFHLYNVDGPWRHCDKWNESERKINFVLSHLYEESKNIRLIETENGFPEAGGGGRNWDILVSGYKCTVIRRISPRDLM